MTDGTKLPGSPSANASPSRLTRRDGDDARCAARVGGGEGDLKIIRIDGEAATRASRARTRGRAREMGRARGAPGRRPTARASGDARARERGARADEGGMMMKNSARAMTDDD